MPVTLETFSLSADTLSMSASLNKQAKVEVHSAYDLWAQSFDGNYSFKAKNFHHEDIVLRQADIKGTMSGNVDDVKVEGKGTALDAKVQYKVAIKEEQVQDIEMKMMGVSLGEMLALAGQSPLAKGKVDIDIKMPNIGEKSAEGYGKIILHKSLFDRALMKKLYQVSLPKRTYVDAKIEGKLKGEILDFFAKLRSNLFSLDLKKASVNLETETLSTAYVLFLKDLGLVTDNRLRGPLEATGKIKAEKKKVHLSAKIKAKVGNLSLNDVNIDSEKQRLTSPYDLYIPKLERLHKLIGKKLYGSLKVQGDVDYNKVLTLKGKSTSLGGLVNFRLKDKSFKSTFSALPVEKVLKVLGHKKFVKGKATGVMTYNLGSRVGKLDADIKDFQLQSSSTTNTVKKLIGKDPARIIYTTTTLHADIKGDVTTYVLHAKGSHSSIDITEGRVDKKSNSHSAKFKFVYDKYIFTGKITGSTDHPKVLLDPSSLMQGKTGDKIQKNLDKALGEDVGKAVGGFLKGLKF
ncbi:MAG: hypothetical protein GQ531_11650 [Sulfurovum sp.]|nr:hypothetical protein [Sulfurovum sp.]